MTFMRSYDWWQTRLGEDFFGTDQAERPLLFFIDDDEAERLHSTAEEGIDDLCAAVAREAIGWSGSPFRRIYQRVLTWRWSAREEPPPCLPLLAVCVLAATRMQ